MLRGYPRLRDDIYRWADRTSLYPGLCLPGQVYNKNLVVVQAVVDSIGS